MIAIQGYKVRSVAGHHIKIIEALSSILGNEDISVYANNMRKTRNTELYDGGILITEKEAKAYLKFINSVFKDSDKVFKKYFDALL